MRNIKVVSLPVTEWDMVSAGISALAEEGHISESVFRDLRESNKQDRVVLLGKAMGTSTDNLAQIIEELIRKYVNEFISINNIRKKDILEIAKDAVFLINVIPKETKFGDFIRFMQKNKYYYTIEFPVKKGDTRIIKVYKCEKEIKCRGAKIDKGHPAYNVLFRLLSDAVNKDTRNYARLLKGLVSRLRDERELINGVDNSYLSDIFREVFNLL